MDAFAARILAEDFGPQDREIRVGGIPCSELARRYGTPLYVYDLGRIRRDVVRLAGVLPPETRILYSIKANPLLALVTLLGREGCGAEVASAGELAAALRASIAPDRIVFAGPGKSREEHLAAIAAGIRAIHLESSAEADRLAELAGRGRVDVGLRINPARPLAGAGMRMAGGTQAFGVDEEEALALAARLQAGGRLHLKGLHIHLGAQIGRSRPLAEAWERFFDLAAKTARLLGRPLDHVDLGGGLAVPVQEGEVDPDLDALGELLAPLWAGHQGRTAHELLVEPGRFLVARAGLFLARVMDVKRSRGERFLVLDGGMQANALAAGTLGQVFRRPLPLCLAGNLQAPEAGPAHLVGPLCTPVDTLARSQPFPEAAPGDLVAFLRCGAYAWSASHLAFLSRPVPAEAVVLEGQSWLARPAGSPEAWLEGQRVPPGLLDPAP